MQKHYKTKELTDFIKNYKNLLDLKNGVSYSFY